MSGVSIEKNSANTFREIAVHGLYCAGVETQCLYAVEICNFGGDNEIWREANSSGERRFWDKRGLKLRVPGQFKTMKRKTKPPVCCFFFLRPGLKTGIALPTRANLSSTPENRILPPSLNSPKPGRARSRHGTKAGAHR